MKYTRVLPIESCVIIQSDVFQEAINEIFGVEPEFDLPNWRYEVEDDYLARNGLHELTPESQDGGCWIGEVTLDDYYIPGMILANMICDGYIPEGADHYYIDCSY